jgi:porin
MKRQTQTVFQTILFVMLLIVIAAAPQVARAEETDTEPKKKLSLMTILPPITEVSDYQGSITERATLFPNLGGTRQSLYEHGIAIDADIVQVGQGVVSGGKEKTIKYTGTSDYYLFLDTGRLGAWPGGLFGVHGRSKFGRSANGQAGSISPVNFNYGFMDFAESNATFLTEYYLWQVLLKQLIFVGGRMEWTALADLNAFANDDKTQFLNVSLRNTALLGSFVSTSTHGVGLVILANKHVSIIPVVLDSTDKAPVWGTVDGLFDEVTTGAEVDINWKLRGLPGNARPAFVYDTKSFTALDNPFLVPSIIKGIDIPKKTGNWFLNLNFDQYIYMPEKASAGPKTAAFEKTPEGIGIFFRFGYTPEDRNPWNVFLSGGVGGRGVIPGRQNDRYGIGFYALLASDDLKDQPILGGLLDTEWGMEVFYNVAIFPWLQVTPDLQYIQSGLPGVDDSVVIAARVLLQI